jgi:hypothetical protein
MTAFSLEDLHGGLGLGRALPESGGVAAAAGQFAPDHGGFQKARAAILGADTAGDDVGRAGFIGQETQVQQLQQRGVAAGQPFTPCSLETAFGIDAEQPLQIPPELEHRIAHSAYGSSHVGTARRRFNAQSAKPEPTTLTSG